MLGLGAVRSKLMALILGPDGFGIFGVFSSIYELARNVAVMGLNSSGVRQIAEADSAGNTKALARTVETLRRVVWFTGGIGALLLLVMCLPIAKFSFEDRRYTSGVALLAAAVFFGAVSAAQIALLQGLRRIGDLARANMVGAVIGTIASVPLIYIWGEKGIAPALVCVAIAALVGSWWYCRHIQTEHVSMSIGEVYGEASDLLKLGFVFMATGMMTLAVPYLVRIMVLRQLGTNSAGYYHSAWQWGGLYVGYILQAMGADFFPRLTAAVKDHSQCNRLVNEQAETGVLLAGPGILGTLTFAPLVIQLFYSAKFGPAVEILRWFSLGMMMRVASWPMSFILLAKGARRLFFWSDLFTNALQLSLVWLGLKYLGLRGAGAAFFGSYLVYWILIYVIVRSLTGFRWSSENKKIGSLFALLISIVFLASFFLNFIVVAICGSVITIAAGIFSLKKICSLVPLERFPKPARRVLRFLGLVS